MQLGSAESRAAEFRYRVVASVSQGPGRAARSPIPQQSMSRADTSGLTRADQRRGRGVRASSGFSGWAEVGRGPRRGHFLRQKVIEGLDVRACARVFDNAACPRVNVPGIGWCVRIRVRTTRRESDHPRRSMSSEDAVHID